MIYLFSLLIMSFQTFSQEFPYPRGFYSNGSLHFSWELPLEGEGYARLFSARDRGWATAPMIEMIEKSASDIFQLYPGRDRLLVGDISAKDGGKISRHASHQNGLDVDLAYYRMDGVEQPLDYQDGFLEDMVRNGKVSSNFDIFRNWELVKMLHRFGKVTRIFVDEIIKKEFCKHAELLGEKELFQDVLKNIRPYPNHSDHLHVRLDCPDSSPECTKQLDHGAGVGC